MKIRGGFVSNSSSSSFYIALRQGELTYEGLLEALDIKQGSPAEKLFGGIVEFLSGREPLEEIDEWYPEEIQEVFRNGWKVYEGRASSESYEPTEMFFYDNELNIDSPDLKIIGTSH